MTIRRSLALTLPLLAFALAGRAQEPAPAPPSYEVEVGVRTLDVSGSEDMYRTQINERSGVLLRSFTLLSSDSFSFFDRLRIDAADLGAGPARSLRIEADKADRFRFRFGYRHSDAFSALSSFANGQHTYDRTRDMLDADLDFLPGRAFTPFFGFSLHRLSGPGTTTYAIGGDEFRLSQDLKDREHEIRLGSGFNLGRLYGSVTQGWRSARTSESLTLEPADGGGNNADPVLGRPVVAGALTREDTAHVSTPFTSAFITGQPGKRVRLTADYARFAADSSGELAESASGAFVSFALSRFFNGLSESATSSAKNTTWRGGGRAEVALSETITAFAGYQTEHRDLQGSALINTLYLQTLTFGGIDPRDVQVILAAKSSIERDEDVLHAGAAARALGPFAVRVELRDAKQDVTVAPDLAEIVVPGSQGGDFQRRIKTLDANASYSKAALTLGAAYRRDRADEPIFRTDFRDRNRLRLRAAWKAPKWGRAGVTAEETKQMNDQPGIDLDGKVRQYSADVEVAPHDGVALRGSFSRFQADNNILIRRPENFTTMLSVYAEDGRSGEGGVAVNLAPLSFDVSAARFRNRGSNPFDIHPARMRLGYG